MSKNFFIVSHPLNTIFVIGVALFLVFCMSTCYAESAVEAIEREAKNARTKPSVGTPLVNKNERDTQETKSKALISAEAVAKLHSSDRPKFEQRIDEISVEAQREPEDFKPPAPTPFQKMRAALDRVGPNLPSAVLEYTSTDGIEMVCTWEGNYCNKSRRIPAVSRAGDLRTDGKLGSGTFR